MVRYDPKTRRDRILDTIVPSIISKPIGTEKELIQKLNKLKDLALEFNEKCNKADRKDKLEIEEIFKKAGRK